MAEYEIKNSRLYGTEEEFGEVITYKLTPEELEIYTRTGELPEREDESMADRNMKKLMEMYPDLQTLEASMVGKTIKQWEKEHGVNNYYFYQLRRRYKKQAEGGEKQSVDEVPEKHTEPEKHYLVVKNNSDKAVNHCDEQGKIAIMAAEDAEDYQLVEISQEECPMCCEPEETHKKDCGGNCTCQKQEDGPYLDTEPDYIVISVDDEGAMLTVNKFDTLADALDNIRMNYSLMEVSKVKLFAQIPYNMRVSIEVGNKIIQAVNCGQPVSKR